MQFDKNKIINDIKIVLVETTHPGNIGAAARAMKTMGISRLGLVRPNGFPGAEATARAAGADDILEVADLYDSLEESVKDCSMVFATSTRARNLPWPVMDPEASATAIMQGIMRGGAAAIVFGRESSGLSNEDLELCNAVIRIPSNELFPCLNIAAAIQIICYELRKAVLKEDTVITPGCNRTPPATSDQMINLYEHLQQCLIDLEFYNPERPKLLMRRMKLLFNRMQLDQNEYNIIRGILAAAQKAAKKGR